jgi:hypothetical protein
MICRLCVLGAKYVLLLERNGGEIERVMANEMIGSPMRRRCW